MTLAAMLANEKKKTRQLDNQTARAVYPGEFSRANMRSMLANNQYRFSTRNQDYITVFSD
jgi:hypothetical protein